MRRMTLLAVACALAFGIVNAAHAQGRDTGSIRGIITDPDGQPLPGVTVTATSDALIGGVRTTTTNVEGVYRFPGLQPGTYGVRVELQGFSPVVVDEIIVNVGVTLTIDSQLQLAGVAETVSVTGEAPIIDTTNPSGSATWGQEQLQEIPSAMDLWSYIQQVPGLVVSKENVGGNESVQLSAFSAHGSESESHQYNMNGMDMTLFEHGIGLGYFNTDAFEEIQFTTSGISAEYSKGGMVINTVVKDGGNEFHGGVAGYYEGPGLQGDNVDQNLRDQGVTSTGGNLNYLADVSAELGGPLVKNNVWFYTAAREYRVVPYVVNCVLPDGSQCTDGSFLTNFTGKVTARVDDSSQFMVNGEWARKQRPNRGVSQFTAPEAAFFQDGRHYILQGKYNRVIGNNAFLDVYGGWGQPPFPLAYQDGVGGATSAYDVVTGRRTDAASLEFFSLANQYTFGSNYTVFVDGWLGASHDLKVGVEHRRGDYLTRTSHNDSLERRYANGVPFRVRVFNSPVEVTNDQRVWAGYLQDDIRMGSLVLNIGARLENHSASIPQQPANDGPWVGPIFPQQPSVAPTDCVACWTTLSPRLGFTWDVSGNGRTAVKASYGRYYFGIDNTDVHTFAIPTGNSTAEFGWTDLNGNDYPDYPDEFGSRIFQTVGVNRQLADDFDTPHSDEFSAAIDHSLDRRSAVSVRFTYRKNSNLWASTWANLPPSAWNIPSTAVDPITGNTVNYWSIDPAFVGIDQGQTLANFEDNWNRYRGVDFTYTRRFDGTWMMTASTTISDKYGRVGGFTDRNEREILAYGAQGLDQPFAFKLSGLYVTPQDINIGLAFRHGSGMNVYGGSNNMARELLVRDATTGSFYSIRVEENGEFRQEATNILDLRLAKTFEVGDLSIEAMIDGFNMLNANNILRTGVLTGSNLGVPFNVMPPRIFRLGMRVQF